MLRKLVVLICLMSFAPASAGAQDLAASLMPKAVAEQASAAQSSSLQMVVAANDVGDRAATDTAGQKETKSRPSCTVGEFFDIHFGGYRWLWWAGAAAALVAIHVAAAD